MRPMPTPIRDDGINWRAWLVGAVVLVLLAVLLAAVVGAVSDSAVEVRGGGTPAALEPFASPPLGLTPVNVALLTGMLGGESPVAAGSSVCPPADAPAVPAFQRSTADSKVAAPDSNSATATPGLAIYGVQGAGAWACAS